MKEGIEELDKIAKLADEKILTESEFQIRLYSMLLDIFRAFNLRESKMTKKDFDNADSPPKEIMQLFEQFLD